MTTVRGGVLIVAGEASGDLHGAGLVRALRETRPDLDIYGIGGDRMKAAGMDVLVHISGLSFMGFVEVVKNLKAVNRIANLMRTIMDTRKPAAVVLIDYPGFNLRLAREAARRSIPVLYYISPQVWAWHRSRVKTIRDTVTKMKVVLPFEEAMYREERVDAEFVGHPLAEILRTTRSREQFAADFGLEPEARLLALLPGSRLQEIHHILPAMLGAAEIIRRRNNVQVAVGVAPNLGPEPFARYGLEQRGVRMIEGATYDLMAYADAAVVTSGTATLETGWFGTPMVIVYRTSPITYAIGRLVVNVPCIGLVNILAGRKLVPELIQADCNAEKLAGELTPLVFDESRNGTMRQDLAVIKSLLGAPGASQKVARAVLELVDAA